MPPHPAAANHNSLARLRALDARLLRVPRRLQRVAIAMTMIGMIVTCLPHVPRAYVDFARIPLLNRLAQDPGFGTDTIADMYEAKVVLNDPGDMYTKAKLDQTPLEAQTWTKAESAPYLPAVLLTEAGLYWAGARTGIGFYGMVLLLAIGFVASSAVYFLRTRWYLFPLLYANFSYFGYRFVAVQDGSYLVMLAVVLAALWLARRGHEGRHALMALAIAMKISPLFYVLQTPRLRRATAMLFVGILLAGLVLPYAIWDNYLYIFQFNAGNKGSGASTIWSLLVVAPFAIVLAYVQARQRFDAEDVVGWSLVPLALFLSLQMNVARHLLIVLLVPDKRGGRNLAAAVGAALPALFPATIHFNAAAPIATAVLGAVLVSHLRAIGWSRVRADLRQPFRTARELLLAA